MTADLPTGRAGQVEPSDAQTFSPVPIGRRTLTTILVPMVVPFLLLPLLRFPFDAILAALFKALL